MANKLIDDFPQPTQNKIKKLLNKRVPLNVGKFHLPSKLIMAPMAGITNSAFRLLTETLGAGATVSELISCHGIAHKNKKTLQMITPHKEEKNWGIQLFGEDGTAMANAAKIAEEYGPKFIDINAGCPVKKVVGKGGGSALLQNLKNLETIIISIKKAIHHDLPLTLKIRIGWDNDSKNAEEVIKLSKDCGIDLVAIHGRTRNQQYGGRADWDYIENIANKKIIPLIGNGDLNSPTIIKERLKITNCDGLMVGRGALRNPFIFLESFEDGSLDFDAIDFWNIITVFHNLMTKNFDSERVILIQTLKHIVWYATGFPNVANFRSKIYKEKKIETILAISEDFFKSNSNFKKTISENDDDDFLTSGHG